MNVSRTTTPTVKNDATAISRDSTKGEIPTNSQEWTKDKG